MRGNRNIGIGLIIGAALCVLVFTLLPYLAPNALGVFGGLFCGGGTLRVSTDNFVHYQCVGTSVSAASQDTEEATPEPTAEATEPAAEPTAEATEAVTGAGGGEAASGAESGAAQVEEEITPVDNTFGLLMYVLSLTLFFTGVYFLTIANPPQKTNG